MREKDESLEIEQNESQPLLDERLSLAKSQAKNYYLSGFASLPIMIAIAVILGESDDTCEKPIREWLKVIMIVSAIFVAGAVAEFLASWLTKAGGYIFVPFFLLSIFHFIWYIFGSIWFFNDDNCEDDWHDGYLLSFVLLLFFYVCCGLLLLILCCCCCCFGVLNIIGGASAMSTSDPSS
jgi:hypothetical protein